MMILDKSIPEWHGTSVIEHGSINTGLNHGLSLCHEHRFAEENTNAKLLHPGGMASCSRWLSPSGDTTGKHALASSILKGCQTCGNTPPLPGAPFFWGVT
jgi:hypothetical protein